MLRLRRLTDRLYIVGDQHWVRLADRFYRYCYLSKLPTDEFVSADEVELHSLPTSQRQKKQISSKVEKKVEEQLSEDQVKKPVAPGLVDDAYVAFTSGGS